MTQEEDPGSERLVDLAGMVDSALRTHDRSTAVVRAEHLLDALFVHHRALRPLRARCDRFTADLIETQTVSMIAEAALVIGQLTDGRRWPEATLRRDVEELIDLEAHEVGLTLTNGLWD